MDSWMIDIQYLIKHCRPFGEIYNLFNVSSQMIYSHPYHVENYIVSVDSSLRRIVV